MQYIELISERAKKRGAEMVDCVNQHNYNTGYCWYCNGDKIYYCASDEHEIPAGTLLQKLRWFVSGFIAEEMKNEVDWKIVGEN